MRLEEGPAKTSNRDRAEATVDVELWGGVECTVRRVGDEFLDQVQASGHADRPEDLVRFAELGLRALRYPVLWERVAPLGLDRADWSWSDGRLATLEELGLRPIVGLLHHGSGPRSRCMSSPRLQWYTRRRTK